MSVTAISSFGPISESAAESTLRLAVWLPSSSAATVRKLSAADCPPAPRTVEIGFDQDLLTEVPELRVTDSKPVPAAFNNQSCHTWCGFGLGLPLYASGDVFSVTAA